MSSDGEKANPMDSLSTLVAILDDGASARQRSQFHSWVISGLAIKPARADYYQYGNQGKNNA